MLELYRYYGDEMSADVPGNEDSAGEREPVCFAVRLPESTLLGLIAKEETVEKLYLVNAQSTWVTEVLSRVRIPTRINETQYLCVCTDLPCWGASVAGLREIA